MIGLRDCKSRIAMDVLLVKDNSNNGKRDFGRWGHLPIEKKDVLQVMTYTVWNYVLNAKSIIKAFNIQPAFNVCRKKSEKLR